MATSSSGYVPEPQYSTVNGVLYKAEPFQGGAQIGWIYKPAERIGAKDLTTGDIVFDTMPSYQDMAGLAGQIGDNGFLVGGQRYKNVGGTATAVDASGRPIAQGLAEDYKKAYGEAKRTNEARYGEIKGGYENLYTETMAGLEGMGEQEAKDIRQDYASLESQGQQDLTSRGLAGTTILPNMRAGVARQKTDAMGRLGERLRREKLGYATGLTGDKLSFMERREDTYPDYNMLARLAGLQGMSGGTIQWS